VQLQAQKAAFDAVGIHLVALTYDAPEVQQRFVERFAVTYPLLSDIDAATVSALGILNTEYQPGDSAYGIPWPGIVIVRPDGTIAGKLFLEPYETRIDAASVLEYADGILE
jgi:peroxiredoxin